MGINEHVMHMEQQLTELTKKVDKIHEALLGNEYNKEGGIVTIVNDHERRIEALENTGTTHLVYVNILKFIAAVITTGVLGFLISLILKK